MKAAYITMPVSLLMAACGVGLILMSRHATSALAAPAPANLPVHPVTPDMAKATAGMALKSAANFSVPDSSGKVHTLADLTDGKPMYIYFILDNCPCSTSAEPLFHNLYARYKGKINFVGVINADIKGAGVWAKSHGMPYTILADAKCDIVHKYGAKHSVYNALVTPEGKILKRWPGYSADMLKEVNAKMAELIGEPVKPFDPLYAPTVLSSGCLFPWPSGS